jgi:1-pyrroline-5-carboxylate dehydrogenase
VIDEDSLNRLQRYIDIGNGEGELLAGGKVTKPEDGYFVEPTVFGEIAPDSRSAQDEIFGPLLALVRASSFDHAIEIANNTEYGLTGAVFTNSRERIEQARREFHVGNLYINRKCTGAMVGVHPFGGFNMSGTDSKAGGPDYLLLFSQAQSVAERL